MTFFSYVDRQKMRIRENHSGEEKSEAKRS